MSVNADDTTSVTNLNDSDNIELNSEIDKIRLWLAENIYIFINLPNRFNLLF